MYRDFDSDAGDDGRYRFSIETSLWQKFEQKTIQINNFIIIEIEIINYNYN